MVNDFIYSFFQLSCGNNTVSQDAGDTLSYACANDSKQENFTIESFRYFQVDEGQSVFMHCEFKVCLENTPNSDCECPTIDECNPNARKRRSLSESVVYRVTTGPYYSMREEQGTDDNGMYCSYSQSIGSRLLSLVGSYLFGREREQETRWLHSYCTQLELSGLEPWPGTL